MLIFQREGKTYEETRLLADEISQDKELWLNTLIEKEQGISPEDTGSPIMDALAMGASFIMAALTPIVPYLFLTGLFAIGVSVLGGLIGRFVLGMAKGRLVQRSPICKALKYWALGWCRRASDTCWVTGFPGWLHNENRPSPDLGVMLSDRHQEVNRIVASYQVSCSGNGHGGAIRNHLLHFLHGLFGEDVAVTAAQHQCGAGYLRYGFPKLL